MAEFAYNTGYQETIRYTPFFANSGINPEYEMIGHLIQGKQTKPAEMTHLHESLRNEMVAAQLRQKNTTIYTESPIRTYNEEIWSGCYHAISRPEDHQRNWTTRNSDHSKSWQRLGQAHISWPYHPQWRYTTHSISPSLNVTKKTDSPHRSKNPLLLFREKEKTNTNSTKSSTLDSTTTSSNIELSGRATHQNTIKSGTPQKASTMPNTQSHDSTGATQESPQWMHVTINRSSSAPSPMIKQERHSHSCKSDAQRIARNATPTSPEYSGSPKGDGAHASMNWTDCTNDECQIHLSEKQGSCGYPQFTRRSRKPSVAHDHDCRQVMEASPGEDWVPKQPPQRRARRAHPEITSWEHCFNDKCNDH